MTVSLPVVTPTKTNFIHTRVRLWAGLDLVIDGNSKITAGNGTYALPAPNAFSLPAASVSGLAACPGSTEACRSACYVRGLAKHAPDVYAAYSENASALAQVLENAAPWRTYAAFGLASWINANARGGFRWHVSGDVWNELHAEWIVSVCMLSSSRIRHWIYTRTLDAVPILMKADNLAVNVSADKDNFADAARVAARYGARLCYMTSPTDAAPPDLPPGSVIFPDYPHRGRDLADPTSHAWWRARSHAERKMVCPADQFGQSEEHRCGPCAKCLVPARVLGNTTP